MPVSSSPQAEETRSEEALDEDIDGAPLSGEEKDDEDLDGVPLDGAALLKSALMRAIPDVDAATPKRETPKRDEYLDEIDGIPCKPVQVIETSFLITKYLKFQLMRTSMVYHWKRIPSLRRKCPALYPQSGRQLTPSK